LNPTKGRAKQTWVYVTSKKTWEFENESEARNFEEEHASMILEKREFASKAEKREYEKTQKRQKTTPVAEVSMVTPEKMTAEKLSNVEAMKNILQKERKTDNLLIIGKINGDCVTAIVKHLDEQGRDKWFHKPDHFALTARNYVKHLPREDPKVNNAILGLRTAVMRDNDKGVNDAKYPMTKNQKEKKKDVKSSKFPMKVAYTVIDIGKTDDANKEARVKTLLEKIGKEVRKMQMEEAYQVCLEYAIRSETFVRYLHEADGKDFKEYIEGISVSTQITDNLNKHIIRDDANKILLSIMERQQNK
jgi:hypothetical protein